jgi:methionyl-tRNA formyltransferase
MAQYSELRVIVFSPMKLRHRVFVKTLLANNVVVEKVVIKRNQNNLTKNIKKCLSISFILDKLLTTLEYVIEGPVELPDVVQVTVNDYNEVLAFNEIKQDLLQAIVVYGGPVIPSELISQAQKPLINIHGAILPGYRGLDSHWWLLIEKKYHLQGYTIHLIDGKIDSGKILKTRSFNSQILSVNRILLWRIWIAKKSGQDIVELLRNKLEIEMTAHDLNLSTYRSSISIANILKSRKIL